MRGWGLDMRRWWMGDLVRDGSVELMGILIAMWRGST
jgi:hypothetical protein